MAVTERAETRRKNKAANKAAIGIGLTAGAIVAAGLSPMLPSNMPRSSDHQTRGDNGSSVSAADRKRGDSILDNGPVRIEPRIFTFSPKDTSYQQAGQTLDELGTNFMSKYDELSKTPRAGIETESPDPSSYQITRTTTDGTKVIFAFIDESKRNFKILIVQRRKPGTEDTMALYKTGDGNLHLEVPGGDLESYKKSVLDELSLL